MTWRLISHAATHPGAVRPRNEDALLDRPDIGLWAVADGAGGHGAGDVASAAIVAALGTIAPGLPAAELLAQVRLKLTAVHQELQEEAARRGPGRILASTVVVMLARGEHFAMLWAGDSRGYLMRGGAAGARHPRPFAGAGTGRPGHAARGRGREPSAGQCHHPRRRRAGRARTRQGLRAGSSRATATCCAPMGCSRPCRRPRSRPCCAAAATRRRS